MENLPDSQAIAGGLVLVWGFVAPLTVFKWLPMSDTAMKAVTMVASLVIAFLALLLSGSLGGIDLHSAASLFVVTGLVYGEQQFVWTLFKDNQKTAVAVRDVRTSKSAKRKR